MDSRDSAQLFEYCLMLFVYKHTAVILVNVAFQYAYLFQNALQYFQNH